MPVCTYMSKQEEQEKLTDDKEILCLLDEVNKYVGTNFSVLKNWNNKVHKVGWFKKVEEPLFTLIHRVGDLECQIIGFCGKFNPIDSEYPFTMVVTRDVIINYLLAYRAGIESDKK